MKIILSLFFALSSVSCACFLSDHEPENPFKCKNLSLEDHQKNYPSDRTFHKGLDPRLCDEDLYSRPTMPGQTHP